MQVHSVRCLTDNYAHVLVDVKTGFAAVVDPSAAEPVEAFLKKNGLKLQTILCTHHHGDHVGGIADLKNKYGCKVIAYNGDAHRIPSYDITVSDNEEISLGNTMARVLFIPGHTLGHIAYYFPTEKILFCGDTLFHLGCGRLFEGTAQQMWKSLSRLAELPNDTLVYCAHEYTMGHCQFAEEQFPNDTELADYCNKQRHHHQETGCTVPSRLGDEKKYNPFLRAKSLSEFAKLRDLKNHWQPHTLK